MEPSPQDSVQTFGKKVSLISQMLHQCNSKHLNVHSIVNELLTHVTRFFLLSQKTAIAVALCKRGKGLIKINGCPIELLEPEILRVKAYEPVLLLGASTFAEVDIRIRVKGGGYTSQIYAIRQAISKAIVAFYQKCKFDHL